MSAKDTYLAGIDLAVKSSVFEDVDEAEEAGESAVTEVEAAERPRTERALVPIDEAPATSSALPQRLLKSEIGGVKDEQWTDFAFAMKSATPSAVSASNELGMFALKPRRLADLGLMRKMMCTRSPTGRMVWVGEFVPPLTQKAFLASPKLQYKAFVASMKKYVAGILDGNVVRPDGGKPDGMTLSGALAILHRCGPSGLKTWNDESKRFDDTVALYERTNGIF